MSVKFSVYQGSESLTEVGTLLSIVGAKGTLAFIPKNLASTKRVAIVAKNKKGESAVVTCSSGVSQSIRKALAAGTSKNAVMAVVCKLQIPEGESGIPYICAPAGENAGLEEFAVETLSKDNQLSYEEMVAF